MKSQLRSLKVLNFVALLLGIFLATQSASAQSVSPGTTPKVVEFSGDLRIGREVTLTVAHLSEWARDHDPQRLVLYLNGRPLKHLYPEQVDLSENKLRFHLRASDLSQPAWSDLLHEPRFYRPVTVSVGLEDQSSFKTVFDYDNRLNLTVIPKVPGIISMLLVLVSIPLFLLLAKSTDIIRERGPQPPHGNAKRYSLSRVQTAFWFFLVSIAYVCLRLLTGDLNNLTPSVLALMGINALADLTTRVIGATYRVDQTKSGSLQNHECAASENVSRGFFADILSDVNGYGFHRFQMFAWNVMFGVIFTRSIRHNLAMPNFSKHLLVLMGISAVVFIGFESLQQKVSNEWLRRRVDELREKGLE